LFVNEYVFVLKSLQSEVSFRFNFYLSFNHISCSLTFI